MPKDHDNRRTEQAKGWQSWYKTAQWRKLRKAQLEQHPWCQCPHCREGKGAWREASIVDHHTPHKGDRRAFFNPKNLRSMNKQCHDSFKQSQDKGGAGFLKGVDTNGWPLSQTHHWHTGLPK